MNVIVAVMIKKGGTERAVIFTALSVVTAAVVWACAPEQSDTSSERRKVVVEFSVTGAPGAGTGASGPSAASPREVAHRILSRLDPGIRESARVLDRLPLMALEADADTLMRLLSMPEVVSVEPDREVRLPSGAEASSPRVFSAPDAGRGGD